MGNLVLFFSRSFFPCLRPLKPVIVPGRTIVKISFFHMIVPTSINFILAGSQYFYNLTLQGENIWTHVH